MYIFYVYIEEVENRKSFFFIELGVTHVRVGRTGTDRLADGPKNVAPPGLLHPQTPSTQYSGLPVLTTGTLGQCSKF